MNNIKPTLFHSTEDQKILKKNNIKNNIFREFNKIKDKYVATNNFYISCEVDDNKYEFKEVEINSLYEKSYIKIIPYSENNNLYITVNNKYLNNALQKKEYIDLILVKNISFTINDTEINKNDLLKKFINNDSNIDDKLIEDIYYNKDFSKKIKLNIPINYNNSFENKNIIKKYLFKINLIELNQSFYQEDNKLIL
jgi:hypothetical protein